jgi:glycosyltransferase involved in cell wall biosynthesis
MTDLEKPLITFALITYNQEQFIGEAVESALAQDYENIEIIISDDCSTDRTFEILEKIAGKYRGPHKIIVNRNKTNLGIGGHINKICEIFTGEWLVTAAGDDISLPSRVSEVRRAVQSSKEKVDCIAVQLAEIDAEGRKTGFVRNITHERVVLGASSLAGAGLAYSRAVIKEFGRLDAQVHNEDVVLTARALLLSGVGCVEQPLVLYRSHSANRFGKNKKFSQFNESWVKSKRKNFQRTIAMVNQVKKDAKGLGSVRIPDWYELIERFRIAVVASELLDYGRPKSFSHLRLCLIKSQLLKIWIGVLIFRFKEAKINKIPDMKPPCS